VTPASFVLGLVESALLSAFAGSMFTVVYNGTARRLSDAHA
jgi:hypothetical protein